MSLGKIKDDVWLFATASHVFQGIPKGRVYIRCQNKWADAKYIARTKLKGRRGDLALLTVKHSGNLKCAPLGNDARRGDRLSLVNQDGRRIKSFAMSGSVISAGVRDGDSGTPVYNESREVVGIIWGTAGGQSWLTPTSRLRSFILTKIGKLPTCGTKIAPDPPAPPKEVEAPAASQCDHTEILRRIAALEARQSFNPSELRSVDEQLIERIAKLEQRVEGLASHNTISEQRITAIIERIVAEKFSKVSGELNIRVQPATSKRK